MSALMAKKIVIYSTPHCVFCRLAKEFLAENNISYEEKDLSVDAVARDELIAKSGQLGVPVIDVEGEIIVGFDKPRLVQVLGLK